MSAYASGGNQLNIKSRMVELCPGSFSLFSGTVSSPSLCPGSFSLLGAVSSPSLCLGSFSMFTGVFEDTSCVFDVE